MIHFTVIPAWRKILDAATSAEAIAPAGTFTSLWTETVNCTGSATLWTAKHAPEDKRSEANQSDFLIVSTNTQHLQLGQGGGGAHVPQCPAGYRAQICGRRAKLLCVKRIDVAVMRRIQETSSNSVRT